MKDLNLKRFGITELNAEEKVDTNGGFLPLVAILAIDGIMLACSAIALGMNQALKDHNQ
jgi:hypothetical protein